MQPKLKDIPTLQNPSVKNVQKRIEDLISLGYRYKSNNAFGEHYYNDETQDVFTKHIILESEEEFWKKDIAHAKRKIKVADANSIKEFLVNSKAKLNENEIQFCFSLVCPLKSIKVGKVDLGPLGTGLYNYIKFQSNEHNVIIAIKILKKLFSNLTTEKSESYTINVVEVDISEKKVIYTYLFRDRDSGLYKIGFSTDTLQRLKTLKRKTPYIEALFEVPVNIEFQLHQEFKDFRIIGEWFELTEEHLAYIRSKKCTKEMVHREKLRTMDKTYKAERKRLKDLEKKKKLEQIFAVATAKR